MKIAITGTIASGKSEVSKILISLGYNVDDADKISHDLILKGNIGYDLVLKEFSNILDENREIDRHKLAMIIFNDDKKRETLNNILHPLILNKIKENYQNREVYICEIPLLFEVEWEYLFDDTLLVVANHDIIMERLLNRGYSEKEALSRLSSQMSVKDKVSRAKHVIENNGSIDELVCSVKEWVKEIGI